MKLFFRFTKVINKEINYSEKRLSYWEDEEKR